MDDVAEIGTQVEGAVMDTSEGSSIDVSETTDTKGTDVSTEISASVEPVNLETIRAKYGETSPEAVALAENLMGDYTRKTQELAAERRMTRALQEQATEYASRLEKQIEDLKQSIMPSDDMDFSQMNEAQIVKYLEDRFAQRMQTEIESRIGPLANQVTLSQLEKEIGGVFTSDDFMKRNESVIRNNAAMLANSGMNAATVMKAAAYDLLRKEHSGLLSRTQTKKRTAAKQAGVTTGSDVGAKPTSEPKQTIAEIKAEMLQRLRAGEFGPLGQ